MNGIGQLISDQIPGFDPTTEFHATDVFQVRGAWKSVPIPIRTRACRLAAKALGDSGADFFLRGVDVRALRQRYSVAHDPHVLAVCQSLESMQEHTSSKGGKGPNVLVIADEHHTAKDSRTRFAGLRRAPLNGFTRLTLSNFLDTIYFGPSDHSRLLQAADLATFFLTRIRHEQPERHPEAIKALNSIRKDLKKITRREYLWSP
ncbi:DUF3800 domain-containing protein [Zafaria sp. Z1313]|uniref:DUF3800 domain-containing protein n=1 Tax=Zafaria sp. Z1313 TaxID=3423202 RepID=UPI003D30390B